MPSSIVPSSQFALRACSLVSGVCATLWSVNAAAGTQPRLSMPEIAVGPQYDATHVYVAPGDLQAFVTSVVATFGGHASTPVMTEVTPTVSSTQFQYIWTPVGTLSAFAYTTPVPFPFGLERTGYLVTNMDQAIAAARAAGANVIVEPFKDPIGIDAVIEWPGGVKMQLYWHFTPPSYEPLQSVPENRIYVSRDRIDNFVNGFVRFSHGKVTADSWHADSAEIGRPGQTFRRVRVESKFGKMQVMATDGQLPYPFGYEISGYEVHDVDATLGQAKTQGATILFAPVDGDDRRGAVVKFPGGYIAEIHSALRR
jgi:catechol 2,3-dioxygenase-like lactoylglutathione lyase family enzyme